MPVSEAVRQRKSRKKRRLIDRSSSFWLSKEADKYLNIIASHYQITRNQVVEWLLQTAGAELIAGLSPTSPAWYLYRSRNQ